MITYDFSTLYTTLPHNLIKEKLTEIIEHTFNREGSLFWLVMNHAFLTFEKPRQYKLWSCQNMYDALHYLLDNIFIRLGSKLYRQIVGIQWVLIVLFLLQICFCFVMRETSFCLCQTIIKLILLTEAFNSTFRYLDDFLNIDNPYFKQMVCQIYPIELQSNKANSTDTEAPLFWTWTCP